MEDGSVDLVEEAAKTLTQEMAKGSWTMIRGWITQVFKGNEVKKQKALEELEESRRELTAEGEDALPADEVEQNWKIQLRRLLREDPEAVAELRAILDEVASERGTRNVTNIAHDVRGILIQGTVGGGIHQHETTYEGDHIDMRGTKAKGDVIGTQHNHGDRRRKG
jgi:hypothetical protein